MTALSDAVAALQNFQLNTLQSTESIVDEKGRPSLKFQAAYQRTIRAIEAAIETLALSDTNQDDLLTQIQEALNIALAAQADLSVTTAFIRTRDSAVTGMTIDATTTTITVSAHDRSYLDPTETVSVTGDTVSGLSPSTTYYIHYTDLDYSGGTVGYQVSTSLEGAVPSPTEPFRHYVGTVATPAAGTSTGTPAPDPTWKQVTASGGSGDMLAANNLSDVANAATALSNIGGQPLDADLTAYGAVGNGIVTHTGAGTAAARTITAGTGISVTNGDGVAGNPTISANGWVELLNFDFASGAASTKEIDVTGYKEIMVTGFLLAHAASVQRALQFSTDGGSTWHTTSGDYEDVGTAGTNSSAAAIFGHITATTSARNCAWHIWDNDGRTPVTIHSITRAVHVIFDATASAINRIRLMGSPAGSGTPSASNFTGGTLRVRARI